VLVNGEGQSLRDDKAVGSIIHFDDQKEYTYLMGDATPAYKGKLDMFRRHVLFLRPGIFLILDELSASTDADFQWMYHAFNKMQVRDRHFAVNQDGARLKGWLRSDQGLSLSQTDQFDTPFNTGIPEAYHQDKPNQWHLTAQTLHKGRTARIAAVMVVDSLGDEIQVEIKEQNGWIRLLAEGSFGKAEGWLQFQPGSEAPEGYVKNEMVGVAKICAKDVSGNSLVF
jgi:hypothetical protein